MYANGDIVGSQGDMDRVVGYLREEFEGLCKAVESSYGRGQRGG